MTVVLENGSGVAGANAYGPASFVTTYLANLGRTGEGGWATAGNEGAEEDAAVVGATAFIEQKIRACVGGVKLWRDISSARSTYSLTAIPADGEAVTIGARTYTFRTALALADEVLIATSVEETLLHLVHAILASSSFAGDSFTSGTLANDDVTAFCLIGSAIVAVSKTKGITPNAIATTTTAAAGSWNFPTLSGGADYAYPQPLSFPRDHLYDRDGVEIQGIPYNLMAAMAEYAVRVRGGTTLAPDPATNAQGGIITRTREKVGPIEEEAVYAGGIAGSVLPSYPAADQYLAEYLTLAGAGGTLR